MAQILDFPASLQRAGSNVHTMSGIPGEVVLFPGVRYDRSGVASDAPKAKKHSSATRRDMLELED